MKTYPIVNSKGQVIRVTIPGADEEQAPQLKKRQTPKEQWLDRVEEARIIIASGGNLELLRKKHLARGLSAKVSGRIFHDALDCYLNDL